jgi:hypothetical protein
MLRTGQGLAGFDLATDSYKTLLEDVAAFGMLSVNCRRAAGKVGKKCPVAATLFGRLAVG